MTPQWIIVLTTYTEYKVTVFERYSYDQNEYGPGYDDVQAASVDHNKIVSISLRWNKELKLIVSRG